MGFITPSNGVNVTTKGDLQGFSTVPARVPVGANGLVLTADSTNALGVAWAAAAGGARDYGALTLNNSATVTVVAVAGTFVLMANTTTAGLLNNFTHTGATARLTYTGAATKVFRIGANISVLPGTMNDNVAIRIAKNGVTIAASELTVMGMGAVEAMGLNTQALVSLATNDFIQIFVTNKTVAIAMTVQDAQLTITEA